MEYTVTTARTLTIKSHESMSILKRLSIIPNLLKLYVEGGFVIDTIQLQPSSSHPLNNGDILVHMHYEPSGESLDVLFQFVVEPA